MAGPMDATDHGLLWLEAQLPTVGRTGLLHLYTRPEQVLKGRVTHAPEWRSPRA